MLAVFLKCSFFSRLRLKLVRYKAEQKLSSGQTNKRRGMGRGEKRSVILNRLHSTSCDFWNDTSTVQVLYGLHLMSA